MTRKVVITDVLHFGKDGKRKSLIDTLAGVVVTDGNSKKMCTLMDLLMLIKNGYEVYVLLEEEGNRCLHTLDVLDSNGLKVKNHLLASKTGIPHISFPSEMWNHYLQERDRFNIEYFNMNRKEIKKKEKDKEKASNPLVMSSLSQSSWKKVCEVSNMCLTPDFYPYIRFICEWEASRRLHSLKNTSFPTSVVRRANELLKEDIHLSEEGSLDLRRCILVVEDYLKTLPIEKAEAVRRHYGMGGGRATKELGSSPRVIGDLPGKLGILKNGLKVEK